MKFIRIFFIILTLCLSSLPASARRDPGLDWRQIATEHFLIIYPTIAGQAAARTARIAEQAYPRVRELLGYAPPGLTPVVLNPMRDTANGYAQTIFRKMEFYLASPMGHWAGTRNSSWIETLMYHEYAHLCHGMRNDGFSRCLTTIFGESEGLNLIAPKWWAEGVAVYAETELTNGGRGRNPYHQMRLAANLLSDQPWTLGQIGNSPRFTYPRDRVYLPGYEMLVLLQAKLDDCRFLDRISSQQSAWPFFGLGFVWDQATGHTPGEIWNQVLSEHKEKLSGGYGQERPAIAGALAITRDDKAIFQHPKWTRDGQLIAYRTSTDEGPALVSINPQTKQVQELAKPDMLQGGYDYNTATELFTYTRLLPGPVYFDNLTSDLFQRDSQGREYRLTNSGRCWSPDVSQDNRIVCVVNKLGPTRLGLVDPGSGAIRLIPGPEGAVCLSPKWSPTGTQLAAAVRINGIQDICLIDPATGALKAVTGWDAAGDYTPVWSPDGCYLYFVSDRTGVNQVYAHELETNELYQVTNARFGAFEPDISGDGKQMVFAEYKAGNYQQLVIAPLDVSAWKRVPLPDFQAQPETPYEFTLPPEKGEGYSAWPHLVPTFWMPMLGQDQAGLLWGAASGRRDPLEIHSWWAQTLYQPLNGQGYGDLSYENRETPLILTGRLFSMPLSRWGVPGDREDEKLYWSRAQGLELDSIFTVLLRRAYDAVSVAELDLAYEVYQVLSENREAFPGENYSGLGGGVKFTGIRQNPKDLFPVSGVSCSLRGRAALGGSDYDGRLVKAAGLVHLPSFFQHQALMLAVRGSSQSGNFPETNYQSAPQGYQGGQFEAGNVLTLSAAYRMPLWYIDNGPGLFPVFFHDLWGEMFIEWGAGWDGSITGKEWMDRAVSSLGGELHLDMEWFWYLPARLNQAVIYKINDREFRFTFDLNMGF